MLWSWMILMSARRFHQVIKHVTINLSTTNQRYPSETTYPESNLAIENDSFTDVLWWSMMIFYLLNMVVFQFATWNHRRLSATTASASPRLNAVRRTRAPGAMAGQLSGIYGMITMLKISMHQELGWKSNKKHIYIYIIYHPLISILIGMYHILGCTILVYILIYHPYMVT